MDLIQTGKFIAELRKEKGLTQKELGEIINIDNRIISKWERGRYAPDITVLKELSVVLGVSITELLEGKKNKDNDSITDEVALNSLKYYTKQTKKKNLKIAILIITSLLLLFTIVFGIIKYNEWNIVDLTSTNNDTYTLNGIVIYNRKKSIFTFRDFEYRDTRIGTSAEPQIKELEISLVIDGEVISEKNINYGEKIPLRIGLKNTQIFFENQYIKINKNTKIGLKIRYIDEKTKDNNIISITLN